MWLILREKIPTWNLLISKPVLRIRVNPIGYSHEKGDTLYLFIELLLLYFSLRLKVILYF
jgi:hypothetical protein